jgi:CheY-like chemotaxis protein
MVGKLVVVFAPSFVSLNILVVEKDRDLCSTFEEVLAHDGHTVRVATSLIATWNAALSCDVPEYQHCGCAT